MQASKENNHPQGMPMVPSQAGYAYNPLLAGQMDFPVPQGFQYAPGQFLKPPSQNPMEDLTNAFSGMKPPMYVGQNGYAPVNAGMQGPTWYRLNDGTMLTRPAPQAYSAASYPVLQGPQPQLGQWLSMPSTPAPLAWNGVPQDAGQAPGFARPNSVSSNEEVGPQTPFFAAQFQMDQYKRMGVTGESPQAWSTPSPYSLSFAPQMPQQLMKIDGQYRPADFEMICSQDPGIPKPVPAIFSSEKSRGTLDKCLKNETNTTNVYIRGLHPNTTDDMLHAYGARFGAIMSAKSMLDQSTGACKGFGFIKYHNFDDGENCIRAFFHLGYEAKWARVSHNERLKTLSDVMNTNLYISNLPQSYNEQMLTSIFSGFEVMSSKILRDENGISRGVGFARFATPEICHEIVEKYNGHCIADGYNLSIRFADTADQKKLKSLTAERRNFKTLEYNTAAYAPGSPYNSPVSANFPSPLQARYSAGGPYNVVPAPAQSYAPYGGVYPISGVDLQSANKYIGTSEATTSANVSTIPNPDVKFESPSVIAHAKRASVSVTKDVSKLTLKAEDDNDLDALKTITNASRAELKLSPAKAVTDNGSPVRTNTPSKGGVKGTPSKTPRKRN